jgi:hypothetical protein
MLASTTDLVISLTMVKSITVNIPCCFRRVIGFIRNNENIWKNFSTSDLGGV